MKFKHKIEARNLSGKPDGECGGLVRRKSRNAQIIIKKKRYLFTQK